MTYSTVNITTHKENNCECLWFIPFEFHEYLLEFIICTSQNFYLFWIKSIVALLWCNTEWNSVSFSHQHHTCSVPVTQEKSDKNEDKKRIHLWNIFKHLKKFISIWIIEMCWWVSLQYQCETLRQLITSIMHTITESRTTVYIFFTLICERVHFAIA